MNKKNVLCLAVITILSIIMLIPKNVSANENELNILNTELSTRALPNSKIVYFSVRFPKYSLPSSSRYYDDGVYRGWIPLDEWEDLSSKKNGYVIGYYRGYANRINIPSRLK